MVKIPKIEDSNNHNNIDEKNLKIYYVSKDWRTPPADKEKGEPGFKDVDNPGGWSSFSYCPVFKREKWRKKYKYHCLPACCVPVTKNKDGKRILEGWKFFTMVGIP